MWKKALWLYLGLYVVGVLVGTVYGMVVDSDNFHPAALIMPLLMCAPAVVVALELKEKKVPVIIMLFCLLITAVPLAGILKFNAMSLATIGKTFIFLPQVFCLLYFIYRRLFKKGDRRAAAASQE